MIHCCASWEGDNLPPVIITICHGSEISCDLCNYCRSDRPRSNEGTDKQDWTILHKHIPQFIYTNILRDDYLDKSITQTSKTMAVGRSKHISALSWLLKYQDFRPTWIIFMNDEELDDSCFNNVYIPFDQEFLAIRRQGANGFELTEIYGLGQRISLQSKTWGTWSHKQGLYPPKGDLHARRQNLMGHTFKLAEFEGTRFDPDQIYQDNMLAFLASAMNFTISSRQHSEVGVLTSNGTKTGLYKLLHENEVDLATHPLVVTPERFGQVHFIWPVTSVITHLFIAVGEESDWKSYLKPFDEQLWYALAGWIFICGFCLFQLYTWQERGKKPLPAFVDSFIQAFSPFCAQGGDVASHGALFLCRLMPYINALVLLPAYSGAVLSFLTIPLHRTPFHDIRGFIEDGQHKLSFLPNTYIERYLSTSDSGIAKIIRKKKLTLEGREMAIDANSTFRAMCRDHSQVFIDSVPPDETIPCHILRLDPFLAQTIGVATAQHFPYRKIASRIVRRVHAAGLMDLFQEVRMPPAKPYNFTPLEIGSVAPLFYLLCLLFATSLIMLVLEKQIVRP